MLDALITKTPRLMSVDDHAAVVAAKAQRAKIEGGLASTRADLQRLAGERDHLTEQVSAQALDHLLNNKKAPSGDLERASPGRCEHAAGRTGSSAKTSDLALFDGAPPGDRSHRHVPETDERAQRARAPPALPGRASA